MHTRLPAAGAGGELIAHADADWFNHRRLLGPLGYIPPAEAEADHYRANTPADTPAGLTPQAFR